MRVQSPSVCVIMAAYNAMSTIGRAVASALCEPEVSQVIVVDDASNDDTAGAARASDDGTGRLDVIRLDRNGGPSRARNIAIKRSSAPYIAILDSDDFFLPGRFAALLAAPDFDLVADNLVFVGDDAVHRIDPTNIATHRIPARQLTAADFVEGSISRTDRYKGELGFLKPLMSRAFLDQHGLRYAEGMRLSEDFDLYVRALMAGARFRIVQGCHYVAVERSGSLSDSHSVADLAAVEAAIARLRLQAPPGERALQVALRRHHQQISRKYRHRAVLARKREIGTLRALGETLHSLAQLVDLMVDVLADKTAPMRQKAAPGEQKEPRFLL